MDTQHNTTSNTHTQSKDSDNIINIKVKQNKSNKKLMFDSSISNIKSSFILENTDKHTNINRSCLKSAKQNLKKVCFYEDELQGLKGVPHDTSLNPSRERSVSSILLKLQKLKFDLNEEENKLSD